MAIEKPGGRDEPSPERRVEEPECTRHLGGRDNGNGDRETTWSLFAIGPEVPNTTRVSIRKAPIAIIAARVQGNVTPRVVSRQNAPGEASASESSTAPPSTASPLKKVRRTDFPRQRAHHRN